MTLNLTKRGGYILHGSTGDRILAYDAGKVSFVGPPGRSVNILYDTDMIEVLTSSIRAAYALYLLHMRC